MKTFNIKITGSGSRIGIYLALRNVASEIYNNRDRDLDGIRWEDPTLFTEIDEKYDVDEP